jgi:hypothetical protein
MWMHCHGDYDARSLGRHHENGTGEFQRIIIKSKLDSGTKRDNQLMEISVIMGGKFQKVVKT